MTDSTANSVETAVFVDSGLYWIAIAVFSPRLTETRWVWVLSFVPSIDNITYGLIDHAWSRSVRVQALEQFLASSLLAFIWLRANTAVLRVVPGMKRRCVHGRARVRTGLGGAGPGGLSRDRPGRPVLAVSRSYRRAVTALTESVGCELQRRAAYGASPVDVR